MNQAVMAGIGNILKSEILFAARIHPERLAASLSDEEFERLLATSQDMMRRAYDTNSFVQVFLPPGLRQATGKLGYVYGRSGQIGLRCGGTIAMVRQGPMQRLTFFCLTCQPLDPANPPAHQETVTATPYTGTVHTLEEARDFVLKVGLAEVVHNPKGKLPTLWDALVFTGSGPDAWGEKLGQVWALRQQLIDVRSARADCRNATSAPCRYWLSKARVSTSWCSFSLTSRGCTPVSCTSSACRWRWGCWSGGSSKKLCPRLRRTPLPIALQLHRCWFKGMSCASIRFCKTCSRMP